MKWEFMDSSDKCEGLTETSRFYESWTGDDWLLKEVSANPWHSISSSN